MQQVQEKEIVKTKRNKELSKKKLLEAVGSIIRRDGFQGIGINSIAKEAGVDKVLIYRYFGDLNGLLKEYVNQKDYWLNNADFLKTAIQNTDEKTLNEATSQLFMGLYRALLVSKEFQEITLWELVEKNELSDAFHQQRDTVAKDILKEYEARFGTEGIDLEAISTIISGGIYFMALQSRMVDKLNGLELKSKEGLARIEKSIHQLSELILAKAAESKESDGK